jgi:hypothetical protein
VLFASNLVVHAKVIKTEIVEEEDDPEGIAGWRYYLDVLKVYRGKSNKKIVVRTENTTARLLLTPGKEYIVFALKSENGEYIAGNYCGEVQGVDGEAYSPKTEKKILDLMSGTQSVIEGEVRGKNWELVSGAVLTVSGNGVFRSLKVDKQGYFHVVLKPGTYKIGIPKNLQVTIYSPDGLSNNPDSNEINPVTLVGGQCIQIQLQEQ